MDLLGRLIARPPTPSGPAGRLQPDDRFALVDLGAETVADPEIYFEPCPPPIRQREGAGAEHGTIGAVKVGAELD